jgi:hypothetical protein
VAPVTALGVWWFQPATGVVTDVDGFLYDSAETELASGTLALASIVQDAWNLVTFDTPAALSIDTGYRFAAEAAGQTGFDSSDQGYPIASPDAALSATSGAFLEGGGFPSSTWTGQHGADLEYEEASEEASGDAAFTLSLAVATTGARDSAGVANFPLTLTPAGTGARDSAGVANFPLTLTLAATAPTTAPAVTSGSYVGLLSILRMNAQEYAEAKRQETEEPVECPNDGTPLEPGPDGRPFCRFDGWRPDN